MQRHLLPFGLAARFFNPSFAQTADAVRGGAVETINVSGPRATELADPLTLKAALELALGANAELSAAGRELEALERRSSRRKRARTRKFRRWWRTRAGRRGTRRCS